MGLGSAVIPTDPPTRRKINRRTAFRRFGQLFCRNRRLWPALAEPHPRQQSVFEDELMKKCCKDVQDHEAGKSRRQRGMRHEGWIDRGTSRSSNG